LPPLIENIRSTAFKLAVRYALFFALSTVAIFAITYQAAGRHLLEMFHASLSADTRELIALSTREDMAGLAEEIQERVSQGGANDDYYLLLSDDGRVLAGNLAPTEAFLGWREWERPIRPGSSEKDQLIGLGTKLPGATMVAAQSVIAMSETQQVILNTFAWGTLISILLGLAGGYAQSQGPVQRLREIAHTTRAIVEGRFDKRIPTGGSRDDLDRLSLDINRMLDRIQDLMQSLKQVSSDIAHDLRTPISRLRQGLDALQRRPGTVVETQAAIEAALKEVDIIIDTFDALLRIAQIEGGARRANFRRVDLSAILENLTAVYASVAEDRGHLFEVEIEKGCQLRGDRDLLTQLFANLIENALTHVPVPSTITVKLRRAGKELQCIVADEGPGIPEQEHDKVFRRLYRLERSRTTPGSGLGLSMVAAIADLHGAMVRLENNRPGLIVSVTFDGMGQTFDSSWPLMTIGRQGAQLPVG
jgi:signal transduction histidine kinase